MEAFCSAAEEQSPGPAAPGSSSELCGFPQRPSDVRTACTRGQNRTQKKLMFRGKKPMSSLLLLLLSLFFPDRFSRDSPCCSARSTGGRQGRRCEQAEKALTDPLRVSSAPPPPVLRTRTDPHTLGREADQGPSGDPQDCPRSCQLAGAQAGACRGALVRRQKEAPQPAGPAARSALGYCPV